MVDDRRHPEEPAANELAWRERWIAGVRAGLKEADRGEFATEAEIAAVLDKHQEC